MAGENWTEFDSSIKRGEPTTFAPNQVIKGWTEAMQLMVEGDKWEMYIPSELGYGDSGSGDKIKGGERAYFQNGDFEDSRWEEACRALRPEDEGELRAR